MAAFKESITKAEAQMLLDALRGQEIMDAGSSFHPVLLLSLGRGTGSARQFRGQVGITIESDWRLERARSIEFGSGLDEPKFTRVIKRLNGLRIASVTVSERLPELLIVFEDGRRLTTFCDWCSQPAWSIRFSDLELFGHRRFPAGTDVTPWLYVERGRPVIQYCFDEDVTPVSLFQ